MNRYFRRRNFIDRTLRARKRYRNEYALDISRLLSEIARKRIEMGHYRERTDRKKRCWLASSFLHEIAIRPSDITWKLPEGSIVAILVILCHR